MRSWTWDSCAGLRGARSSAPTASGDASRNRPTFLSDDARGATEASARYSDVSRTLSGPRLDSVSRQSKFIRLVAEAEVDRLQARDQLVEVQIHHFPPFRVECVPVPPRHLPVTIPG